jgi:hypothetical protein
MQANSLARPVNEAGPGGVADVVRRTGGLQAQTWRGAAYAVRARSTRTTSADVSAALSDDRSVIRSWFMRGTLQLVAAEDAGALLELLGPKMIKDTERRYGELCLTPEIRARAADVLEEHLLAHGPSDRAELAGLLVDAGLVPSPKGQAVYALIRHAGLLGRLCYGPGDTWVAVRSWLGGPFTVHGDLEALAHRYLSAYGPATPQDFATWSGLTVPLARRGIESASRLTVDVADTTLYAVDDLPGAEDLRMLGEFDPYLLGYKVRYQDLPKQVFPGGGMLRPAIVRAGQVIGTWWHADLSTELFGERADLGPELADLARFA